MLTVLCLSVTGRAHLTRATEWEVRDEPAGPPQPWATWAEVVAKGYLTSPASTTKRTERQVEAAVVVATMKTVRGEDKCLKVWQNFAAYVSAEQIIRNRRHQERTFKRNWRDLVHILV